MIHARKRSDARHIYVVGGCLHLTGLGGPSRRRGWQVGICAMRLKKCLKCAPFPRFGHVGLIGQELVQPLAPIRRQKSFDHVETTVERQLGVVICQRTHQFAPDVGRIFVPPCCDATSGICFGDLGYNIGP